MKNKQVKYVMGDVFTLPLKLAVNELAIIDKFDRVVGWADAFTGEVARDHFVHAVNEHDRLTEESQKLKEMLKTFIPCNDYDVQDEDGEWVVQNHGGSFQYNEESEHIGLEVVRLLGQLKSN